MVNVEYMREEIRRAERRIQERRDVGLITHGSPVGLLYNDEDPENPIIERNAPSYVNPTRTLSFADWREMQAYCISAQDATDAINVSNLNPLYERQSYLELSIPEKICIIGAGGIGSWIALNMGLIGVNELFIIDYDEIEEHNLNRTPFRDMDIGTTKTSALMDLILERRDEANIRLFEKRLEELTELELKEINNCLIIDCRDKLDPLPELLQNNEVIKLGYDGLSITMIINPDYESVWDLEPENGYNIVPSFLAPCQFLATMAVTLITNPEWSTKDKENEIVTFDLREQIMGMVK